MTVHTRLTIISGESARISDLVDSTHQIILATKKLLSKPVPDTFVGRKTHEFFLRENVLKPPER
jgi:hypothetical protein